MSHRRNLMPYAVPLFIAGVVGLGAILSLLPGRGVEAPLVQETAAQEPGFADYFATGVHLLQVGLPREAASAFENAKRLRPHIAEARINLGYAYLAAGQFVDAEAAFSEALDLKPGQINGYYGWAESLEALDDLPAALGAMRSFVHLSSEDHPYRRRALAAIWEWQTALESTGADGTPNQQHKAGVETTSAGESDASPQLP